eukprot:1916022-Alexandrium_andersonii.AAC.1
MRIRIRCSVPALRYVARVSCGLSWGLPLECLEVVPRVSGVRPACGPWWGCPLRCPGDVLR